MYDLDAIFESYMDDEYDEHDAFYEDFLDSADDDLFEEKLSLPFKKEEPPKKKGPFGNIGGGSKGNAKGKGKGGKIAAKDAMDMKKVVAAVAAALAVSVAVGIMIKKCYSKMKKVSDEQIGMYGEEDALTMVKELDKVNKQSYQKLKQKEKDYRKACRITKKSIDKDRIKEFRADKKKERADVKEGAYVKRCVAIVGDINKIISVIDKIKKKVGKIADKLRVGVSNVGGKVKGKFAKESTIIESVVNDYINQVQYEEELEDLTESVEDHVLSKFDDEYDDYEESAYDDYDDDMFSDLFY